jgi:peptidoglycan/LPS O-acetylase OafA/YrhL
MLGIGFYLAGFPSLLSTTINPDPFHTPMPGFSTLRFLTPTPLFTHIPNADPARFWWSISGTSILLSVSQLPNIKRLFESRACQYLGKISFSLYLVHQFCLVLFGLALQKAMLGLAGVERGQAAGIEGDEGKMLYWLLCGVWLVVFTTSVFAIAAQVEKWVDAPSVRFTKWLEERCLKWYHSIGLPWQ